MLIAVNYHYVRPSFDTPYPGIQGCTPEQFAAQLECLGRAGTFVSAGQVRDALEGGALPARSILITFDDGLREQYEVAWPILRRMGIPAVFFVNTAPVVEARILTVHKIHLLRCRVALGDLLTALRDRARERRIELGRPPDRAKVVSQYPYDCYEVACVKYLLNFQLGWLDRELLIADCFRALSAGSEAAMSRQLYMDVAQIRELAAHGSIGCHSHDHLPLGLLPPLVAREQIQRGISYLEQWTGSRPFAMSYPYGPREVCTPQVGAMAAQAGIRFAFTMERAGNDTFCWPLHLARFDSNDVPGGKACSCAPEEFFEQAPVSRWYAT